MSVKRGDVVLLNAPFVTRPGSKIRPMLVVQSDRNNARMQNTILAAITTNVSRSAEPTPTPQRQPARRDDTVCRQRRRGFDAAAH